MLIAADTPLLQQFIAYRAYDRNERHNRMIPFGSYEMIQKGSRGFFVDYERPIASGPRPTRMVSD